MVLVGVVLKEVHLVALLFDGWKYVYSLLWDHLSVQALLSNKQWGFQPSKSTVTSLLSATYDWQNIIDKRGSAIFFDMQKAFDYFPPPEPHV